MKNTLFRLDLFLVKNKFVESRNEAKQLIINSKISVNDKVIIKPNYQVNENSRILILNNEKYASRGAYKLIEAIKKFKIDFKDKIVLDIGASSGGFTDVCLRNGAKKVYALDVGSNQLKNIIKTNSKVINMENINIKNIKRAMFSEKITNVVCDVSFISLKFVFEALKKTFNNDKLDIVCLIKPQFELDKKTLDKYNGKISNSALHDQAITNVKKYAIDNDFTFIECIPSPILGAKKENKEFLANIRKDK